MTQNKFIKIPKGTPSNRAQKQLRWEYRSVFLLILH